MANSSNSTQFRTNRQLNHTRSPSSVGEDRRPRLGQSFTRPASSFGITNCQRNAPVCSSKHIKMLRSPWCCGSRGLPLLVPDEAGFQSDPILGRTYGFIGRPAQFSSVPREDSWLPGAGLVNTLVARGDRFYIGGSFNSWMPAPLSGLVAYDLISGFRRSDVPTVYGPVFVVVSDGHGGWFVGGEFSGVGNVLAQNLAHIRPDMTVDSDFRPNPDGHGIFALLLVDDILYVGDKFGGALVAPRSPCICRFGEWLWGQPVCCSRDSSNGGRSRPRRLFDRGLDRRPGSNAPRECKSSRRLQSQCSRSSNVLERDASNVGVAGESPAGSDHFAALAQLPEALRSGRRGWGWKSLTRHQLV